MSKEIGIINEIGDIGLGFNPLNHDDAKSYAEGTNNTPQQQPINENENK